MSGTFDIYMAGVGGQGIGLLAEALARAADRAGHEIRGCDTHGLAQRGGAVASHLRLGPGASSPLVEPGRAELVIGLERHEALRAARAWLRPGGILVWYDACWEPLAVRLGGVEAVTAAEIEEECAATPWVSRRVFRPELADPRTQNVAILAELAAGGILPGLELRHYRAALGDLMDGAALAASLAILG